MGGFTDCISAQFTKKPVPDGQKFGRSRSCINFDTNHDSYSLDGSDGSIVYTAN